MMFPTHIYDVGHAVYVLLKISEPTLRNVSSPEKILVIRLGVSQIWTTLQYNLYVEKMLRNRFS